MKIRNIFVLLLVLNLSVYLFTSEKEIVGNSGRIFQFPSPNHDGRIKILIYYDMEGISGQNDIKSFDFGNPEYEKIRYNLTSDVNAVIKGLFAGGADEVHVVDAHGSGNREPDILLDRLDSRAHHIIRDQWFDPYVDLSESGVYDGIAAVCMHSKTGGGGFAAHTYTIGMDWILNDHSISESEIIALSWGRVGVPLILVSGDNTLKTQLSWMHWLEYITVKTAKESDNAILRPLEVVHEELSKAAERALKQLSRSKTVKLKIPIKAQLRAVYPASLKSLQGVPGINYNDETVSFIAMDFEKAYQGITALIHVASRGYDRIFMKVLRSEKLLERVWPVFIREWYRAWLDVESGRWTPSPSKKKQTKNKKYFGF